MAYRAFQLHVGFTGTQKGLKKAQHKTLIGKIAVCLPARPVFHHGDCIGADEDFHNLLLLTGKEIIIHPPIKNSKRAFCKGGLVLEPKDYLDRNHDIVDSSDILIACPSGMEEELRSGTWATIRYARKQKKPIVIIYPDGSIGND